MLPRLLRRAHTRTTAANDKTRFLIVGGGSSVRRATSHIAQTSLPGTAGVSVAHQLYYKFGLAGNKLAARDIVVADAAEYHHYQPGWTLVGAGIEKDKENFRKPLASLFGKSFDLRAENVVSFEPNNNSVTLESGKTIEYEILIVAAGLQIKWDDVKGLPEALLDSSSGVSSIYSFNTCDKAWKDIDALRNGAALFTQPQGVIKCAGAPQKVMWCAWDNYRRTQRGANIKVEFWTGMPTMFSVPKYSDALNALRIERNIRGEFQHNLIAVDTGKRTATFKKPDGTTVDADYTLLHVTPPMGPPAFIKSSPLADSAGWVDVDQGTLQHKNSEFSNIFAIGDCSSLPTSKTGAAITAQAPVLVENVYQMVKTGKVGDARYDGYTSCPLLTGYNQLMLAEFKYGLEPKETFASMFGIDQVTPRRAFYHLKKSFFPAVYWSLMTKGMWYGPRGIFAPRY